MSISEVTRPRCRAVRHRRGQRGRRLVSGAVRGAGELVGSDHVFPRTANKIIKAYATANGMTIGGRYSLAGAVGGALLFPYAKTVFSESWPDSWLCVQGALFVAIMLWAPRGLAGLVGQARDTLARRRPRPAEDMPKETEGMPKEVTG